MLPILRLLRPYQWVKNVFVAAPLAFTPASLSVENLLNVAFGVLCFSATASAVYIMNDWFDRERDRAHPMKHKRPLAAGTVSPPVAGVLFLALAVLGLGGAFYLSHGFAKLLGGYAALNLAYSSVLKHRAILDVMSVAAGFVLRVLAGGMLVAITPSVWMLIVTGLLALFLALCKRRDDVVKELRASHRRSLDGYTRYFLDVSLTMVLGALLVSYLIYTTDQSVMARLGTGDLVLTAPFVLAGLLRYLQITLVEERSGAPTRVILSDPFLWVCGLGWLAVFEWLIGRG